MPLGTEVGLCLRNIVLDRDPAPSPLKGHSPQFSANIHCGQAAGWTKMPLGIELGLGPGDFVLVRWGPRSPLPQRGTDPQFSAHICCGQMAAWIKMSIGIDLGDFVLDGDPVAPSPKRGRTPKIFGPCLL